MKVRWTDEALQDRTAIWDYLAERNFVAAVELDERSARRQNVWQNIR
ncbi:hypothetical protein M5J15_02110 [Serratia symbiotica]|nr:hypothetical protein [Serratia symbiotica]USS96002.1 hypothetical protein M5J15_02110 [Serratia symbiotica]